MRSTAKRQNRAKQDSADALEKLAKVVLGTDIQLPPDGLDALQAWFDGVLIPSAERRGALLAQLDGERPFDEGEEPKGAARLFVSIRLQGLSMLLYVAHKSRDAADPRWVETYRAARDMALRLAGLIEGVGLSGLTQARPAALRNKELGAEKDALILRLAEPYRPRRSRKGVRYKRTDVARFICDKAELTERVTRDKLSELLPGEKWWLP